MYGEDPPITDDTDAVPVEPPQLDWVDEVVKLIAAGLLRITEAFPAQPILSVTVTTYVPAERLPRGIIHEFKNRIKLGKSQGKVLKVWSEMFCAIQLFQIFI